MRCAWLLPLVLGCGLACAAALGDNTVKLAPSKLRLPQNIGPLRYSGEGRFSDRRMGRSFGYNASGISLSIYVYDHGLKNVPDGADSPAACEQFESAKREIEQGGNYQNIELIHEASRRLRPPADSPAAREAQYRFDRNGIHAISVLWMTAANGYFIKVRLSLRAEYADELDEARAQVLDAVATAIENSPPSPGPAPTPMPAPPPEAAAIDLVSNANPADAALWLVYAQSLIEFARAHPAILPPCGGVLIPGFDAELGARRAALDVYRARAAGAPGASYFDALARIDAAGFLDEYVWHYLRDTRRDITPAAGIDLAGFGVFDQHELAGHAAQSGAHVRFSEVRVLPLDPAP